MSLTFIETRVFTRKLRKAWNDDDYQRFCEELANDPNAGDLIQRTGGLRKIRRAAKGRGKSGGVRIIYFWAVSRDLIIMLDIYPKNEKADLTYDEIKRLIRAKNDILER